MQIGRMQLVRVPTSNGVVHFHAGELRGDRPLVVILHGATRALAQLQPLTALLTDFDVILACLPKHNNAPALAEVSVELFAAAYSEALQVTLAGRRVLFVGESLGGVVGLAMGRRPPTCLAGVVALDPFLEGDIWPLRHIVDNNLAAAVNATFRGSYQYLLEDQRVPVHIVAGDSLLDVRASKSLPSLLRPEDRPIVVDRAVLTVIRGGHHLIAENPEGCSDAIKASAAAIWRR